VTPPPGSRARRAVAAGASAALCAAVLAGCSSEPEAGGGSAGQNFLPGNGLVTTLAVADRKRPEAVSGTTLTGRTLSLSDYAGKVVVVNVWGSWCGPCIAEAPILAAAARDLQRKGVVFLGIDSRDLDKAAPAALQREVRAPYESIYDPDGRTLLAFHETLNPKAIPSTLVIDEQGRVAASVNGPVTRATLYGMVEDVVGRKLDGRA
jgi:thiol-disulfide isomerase/thioredoxin